VRVISGRILRCLGDDSHDRRSKGLRRIGVMPGEQGAALDTQGHYRDGNQKPRSWSQGPHTRNNPGPSSPAPNSVLDGVCLPGEHNQIRTVTDRAVVGDPSRGALPNPRQDPGDPAGRHEAPMTEPQGRRIVSGVDGAGGRGSVFEVGSLARRRGTRFELT
jgi:hypothetical protein